MQKLVSIITPVYNGEKFLHRLLDSVLAQTYPAIEMICVNDGSIDKTQVIIESYIPKFKARGYQLIPLMQSNQGQSSAVNNALKKIHGEYLTWPDSDDYYSSHLALEKLVGVLETSTPDTTLARCHASLLDEDTLRPVGALGDPNQSPIRSDLFEDCLFAKNGFWFQPICYMAKTSSLDEKIPNREIFTDRHAGQNWQIMLPLFYESKCAQIPESLCNILVRQTSHSRGTYKSFSQVISLFLAYEATLLHTLESALSIPQFEKESYKKSVVTQYLWRKLNAAYVHSMKDDANHFYQALIDQGARMPLREKAFHMVSQLPFCLRVMNFPRALYKHLRK